MTQRLASLLALALLAGCTAASPSAPPPPAPAAAAAPGGTLADTCRPDPAGTLVTVDRGIGGTGINGGANPAPGSEALADRGIGGTGIGGTGIGGTGITGGLRGVTLGERGGGGTGITGVITGFGSICIDGFELALGHPKLLTVDGASEASRTLHAGDVASVEATGTGDRLRAVSITVRHDVSGPITAVAATGDALDIAGQHVVIGPATRIAAELRPGAWVTVSGLRDPSYAIRASRIEARAPGEVLVAGTVLQMDGAWWIGGLRLRLPPKLVPGGGRVVVGGDYADGTLRVTQLSDDPLVHLAGGPGHLFIEGYPSLAGQEVSLPSGLEAGIGPAFGAPPPADTLVILEVVRQPNDALLALGWRAARQAGGGHAKGPDMPAPAVATTTLQNPAPVTTTTTTTTTAPATTTVATASTTATTAAVTASSASTPTGSSTDSSGTSTPTGSTGGQGSTSGLSKAASAPAQAPGTASSAASAPAGIAPTAPPSRAPPASISEGRPGATSAPGAGSEGGNDGPAAGRIGTIAAAVTGKGLIGTGPSTTSATSMSTGTATGTSTGTSTSSSTGAGSAGGSGAPGTGTGTTTTGTGGSTSTGTTTTGSTGTGTGTTGTTTTGGTGNGPNAGSGGSTGLGLGFGIGRTPPSEGKIGGPVSTPVGGTAGGVGKFSVTTSATRGTKSISHAPAVGAAGHTRGR